MKKVILILLTTLYLFASEPTFYYLGGYEDSFKREILDSQKASQFINKAKTNKYFKKAYSLLNTEIRRNKKNKVDHPDYEKVLDYLKKSDTVYGNWVGMNLYVLTKSRLDQNKFMDKYAIYFAKKNMQQNFCSGYIFTGIFLKEKGESENIYKNIWKNGIKNKCLGTKFEHFTLIARKNNG